MLRIILAHIFFTTCSRVRCVENDILDRDMFGDGARHRATTMVPLNDSESWNVWVTSAKRGYYVLPGGKLERKSSRVPKDETYADAAHRETIEELGIKASPLSPVSLILDARNLRVTMLYAMNSGSPVTPDDLYADGVENRDKKIINVFQHPKEYNLAKGHWHYVNEYRKFLIERNTIPDDVRAKIEEEKKSPLIRIPNEESKCVILKAYSKGDLCPIMPVAFSPI